MIFYRIEITNATFETIRGEKQIYGKRSIADPPHDGYLNIANTIFYHRTMVKDDAYKSECLYIKFTRFVFQNYKFACFR